MVFPEFLDFLDFMETSTVAKFGLFLAVISHFVSNSLVDNVARTKQFLGKSGL